MSVAAETAACAALTNTDYLQVMILIIMEVLSSAHDKKSRCFSLSTELDANLLSKDSWATLTDFAV